MVALVGSSAAAASKTIFRNFRKRHSEHGHAQTRAMPPKKKVPAPTSLGFYPMLKKTAVAISKQCSVPGKYWTGRSASDKEKRYLCTVIEFIAVHDFGGGIKGAGFQVKEMGEDGKQKDFKMGPCIGLQLDMWTDPHTHVAYAGVNAVTVHEPKVTVHEPSSAGSPGVSSKTMAVPQLLARNERGARL